MAAGTNQQPLFDGLSPNEAVVHLRNEGYPIAKATLYKLVHERKIPFTKRGKRLVFSRKDLTNWLREGSIKTNNERLEELENYLATNKKKGGTK